MRKAIFSIAAMVIVGTFLVADPPDWEFLVEPVGVIETYHDYAFGSNQGTPIQVMDDGALYWAFHAQVTPAAKRRAYYAYFHPNGICDMSYYLSQNDVRESYVGVDLDFESQDPIYAFHADMADNDYDDVMFVYDSWHLLHSPNLLSTPFALIENSNWNNMPVDPPFEDDMFIHPDVHVSEAPSYEDDGKRRVYVIARNLIGHAEEGGSFANVMIAYVDFDTCDLDAGSFPNLDWQYVTIPQMDAWNADPNWMVSNFATVVSRGGRLAIIGYRIGIDTDQVPVVFVLMNDTYCEGEWELYETCLDMPVTQPVYEDGSSWQPNATNMRIGVFPADNSSAIWDAGDKIHIQMPFIVKADVYGSETYFPHLSQLRNVVFDTNELEFYHYDIYPKGATPYDQNPFLPWDPDEDWEYQYDESGEIVMNEAMPVYSNQLDEGLPYNLVRVAQNRDRCWMACIWSDELKLAKYYEYGEEWIDKPEIMISISDCGGTCWSDPIVMNANPDDPDGNYVPQLDGQIPRYLCLGDRIEDMGGVDGKLHIGYYDDNYFGPNIHDPTGGTIRYMALEVSYPLLGDVVDTPEVSTLDLRQNHPNPFNPSTTIRYDLPKESPVTIEVFNARGQKVRTLMNGVGKTGMNSVVWNGTDDSGKHVSSGVYLYRLETERETITRKMLLLE